MALELGMDESGAEHVAIVATEACTNLLKHASRGQILLADHHRRMPRPPRCWNCWRWIKVRE